jgi:predicted nucleic acid-binding protein
VIYLDTSIIVAGIAAKHPNHDVCNPLIYSAGSMTSAHALAETFKVLTTIFKFRNEIVATVLIELSSRLRVEEIMIEDYLSVFRDAKGKGIVGGRIYDAIHAQVARRLKVEKIVTYNLRDFLAVAPDLNVSAP